MKKILFILLLFPSIIFAQNTRPLIATDNASNTCNADRMVFTPGALSCSGSTATITTSTGSNPAGFGTELQYRLDSTHFGAVSGSSVDINSNIQLQSGGTFDINSGIILGIDGFDFRSGGVISDDSTGGIEVSNGPFWTFANAAFGTSGSYPFGIEIGSNGDTYGIRRNDGSDPLELGYNDNTPGRGARFFGGGGNFGNLKIMNNEVQYYSFDSSNGFVELSPVQGVVIDGNNGGGTVQLTVSGASGAGNHAIDALGGQVGLHATGTDGATTGDGYVGYGFGPIASFYAAGGAYSFYGNIGLMYNAGNVSIGTTVSKNILDVKGAQALGTYAGINTSTSNSLIVSGNIGIGTFSPFAGKLIVSGGNVGIGSISPGQILDVVGTVRMSGFTLKTSPTNGYVLTSDASGNGTWNLGASGNVGISTVNTVPYYVGTSTLGSSNKFTFNGTNVGIGTTTFASFALLTIGNSLAGGQANISTTGQVTAPSFVGSDPASSSTFNGLIDGLGQIRVRGGSNTILFGSSNKESINDTSDSTGDLTFLLNNIERVRFANLGNVGVGSANPGQLLDVKGTVRVVGAVYAAFQLTAPSIASNDCGTLTQGTVNSNSTDLAGTVVSGTAAGNVLTCSVTFGQSHTNAPASCVCQDSTTPLALAATYTSTKLTCTSLATLASATIGYQCQWNAP